MNIKILAAMSWDEASKQCVQPDGRWRLPTIRELKDILEDKTHHPELGIKEDEGRQLSDVFWSGTEKTAQTAWTARLIDGDFWIGNDKNDPEPKESQCRVILVK
jgi:hypothetical protein